MDLDLYMYVTYMCGKYIIQEICQLLCILEFDSRTTLDLCIFLLRNWQDTELSFESGVIRPFSISECSQTALKLVNFWNWDFKY